MIQSSYKMQKITAKQRPKLKKRPFGNQCVFLTHPIFKLYQHKNKAIFNQLSNLHLVINIRGLLNKHKSLQRLLT